MSICMYWRKRGKLPKKKTTRGHDHLHLPLFARGLTIRLVVRFPFFPSQNGRTG